MKKSDTFNKIKYACIAVFVACILFMVSPTVRRAVNEQFMRVRFANDASSYTTIKYVEDSCRSMITSYTQDLLTYQQYRLYDSKFDRQLAENAKMRANRTAVAYNEYILKNRFVWGKNIPPDIRQELDYIP